MADDEEATPWKEQENWEADQIKKASMKVGTKDRKGKEYDLVLPDQIEFITDMVMAGDVVRPPFNRIEGYEVFRTKIGLSALCCSTRCCRNLAALNVWYFNQRALRSVLHVTLA